MITDLVNKKNDIVAYIKATQPRLSEARIIAIDNLRTMGGEAIFSEWKSLPQSFKGVNNLNLGCA